MNDKLKNFVKNQKGQTGAWEGIIILMLVVALGAIFYYELNKKTDTSIFKAGSQSVSPSPVVHFGGCAIIKEYLYANSNSGVDSVKH